MGASQQITTASFTKLGYVTLKLESGVISEKKKIRPTFLLDTVNLKVRNG
jgi:hypothetical protein